MGRFNCKNSLLQIEQNTLCKRQIVEFRRRENEQPPIGPYLLFGSFLRHRGGNRREIPRSLWSDTDVVGQMEAGSSTDNRLTVGMRKISDVRPVIPPRAFDGQPGGRIEWPIHVTGSVSRIMLHPRLRRANRSLSCTIACIMTRHPVTQGLLPAAGRAGGGGRGGESRERGEEEGCSLFHVVTPFQRSHSFLIGRLGPFNTGLLSFLRPLISHFADFFSHSLLLRPSFFDPLLSEFSRVVSLRDGHAPPSLGLQCDWSCYLGKFKEADSAWKRLTRRS